MSQQAALPERGLENIVQRSFYPLIWNVALADQAEDGRIERCYVPLPIGKGARAIVDPVQLKQNVAAWAATLSILADSNATFRGKK